MKPTAAQQRLVDIVKAQGGEAEYWPTVNDWVRDAGPARSLALTNINRTVAVIIKKGLLTLDEEGYFRLPDNGEDARWTPTVGGYKPKLGE